MSRTDLLSLSLDDLATLSNRGLVKRALAEVEGEQFTATISENKAGTVSVLWSDDVHCLLPSGAPLQNGKCSCPATGLCRHLLRSVLAYQRDYGGTAEEPQGAESTPTDVSVENATKEGELEKPTSEDVLAWNPGDITDEVLNRDISGSTLLRARKLSEAGQVVEVTLGAKPTARFHTLGTNTRFMVRGDIRYTHCDCAEAAPCVHVPLAIWAFRGLALSTSHGLISTATTKAAVPHNTLSSVENLLGELAEFGVTGTGQPFRDKLRRLEKECRRVGLIWPAEVVADIERQVEMHSSHDARFDPVRIAGLVGELLLRSDAIRSQMGAIPDVFVRGAASDTYSEVGAARLIGIGTQARFYRGGVELQAFMQDSDSGALVFVSRNFPDPEPSPTQVNLRSAAAAEPPPPLWKLAAAPLVKGTSMEAMGSGQVLARGGKRAPSGEFSFGRSPLSFNFQNFEWEKLRPPLLSEGFAQIEARLYQAPPKALSPRRAGENIFVVPVEAVTNEKFSSAQQEVHAVLQDANGGEAKLVHPYTSRGAAGTEALLAHLQSSTTIRFVAGRVTRGAAGLQIAPLGLVYQAESKRFLVQPWVGSPKLSKNSTLFQNDAGQIQQPDPLREFSSQLTQALGELWLLGLERVDERISKEWGWLAQRAEGLNFGRLSTPVLALAQELGRKAKVRHWDSRAAKTSLLELSVLASLLNELT